MNSNRAEFTKTAEGSWSVHRATGDTLPYTVAAVVGECQRGRGPRNGLTADYGWGF